MSQHKHHLLLIIFLLSISLSTFQALPQLPDPEPDPAPIKTQPLLPTRSPPATIPAFPEQSSSDGCPLDLPDDFFSGVKSACGSGSKHRRPDPNSYSGLLHKSRCCPVLAAWLYSAYSTTALRTAVDAQKTAREVDMPVLPDDSESCVDSVEKALVNRGVNLAKPNETCDIVDCYCGIRLHPLSCQKAFYVNSHGQLAGGESVKKLERDCHSSGSVNGYGGLNGCSKCLSSLNLLNEERGGNTSKAENRTSKMRSRDCELMGLTWLLNKNRTAYIHTVSAVLRALMSTTQGSFPRSCALNSDGMPLAVDSTEINDDSSSRALPLPLYPLCLFLLSITFLSFLS